MKFDVDGFTTKAVLQAYRFVDANVNELQVDLTSAKFQTVKQQVDTRALPITFKLSISKEFANQADKATIDQAMIEFKRKIQGT